MITTVVIDWNRTLFNPSSNRMAEGAVSLLKRLKGKHIIIWSRGKYPKCREDIEHMIDPKKTVFIGDRLNSEIKIGAELGSFTIWLMKGKYKNEKSNIVPDKIVKSLYEVYI